jgi:hypothetical protein
MGWRLAVVMIVAAGCRGFFDPHGGNWGDAAVDMPGAAMPVVVNTRVGNSTTGTLTTPPLAIGAGDLIVLGMASDGVDATIGAVNDSLGNAYAPVGVRLTSVTHAAEIWYVANALPGTTTVTVSFSSSYSTTVWLAELSGMNSSAPLDSIMTTSAVGAGDANGPAITTSVANELVFVVMAPDYDVVSGLVPGSPFVELPVSNGKGSAYLIAATPGTYMATWGTAGGASGQRCSLAASFKPAP